MNARGLLDQLLNSGQVLLQNMAGQTPSKGSRWFGWFAFLCGWRRIARALHP